MCRPMTVAQHSILRLPVLLLLLAVTGCGWIEWGEGDAAPVVAARPQAGASSAAPTRRPPGGATSGSPSETPQFTTRALPPVVGAAPTIVVGRAETLDAVAKRAHVEPDALAAENGLIRPYALRPGQELRLPQPALSAATGGRAGAGEVNRTAEPPPQPAAPGSRPPESEVAGLPQAPAVVARPPDAPAGGGFLWPVKGRLISGFGTKDNGLRNDGINIAAKRGQPVRAIAPGVVAYAGNELRGFGNLVLIKHDDGWVSAYAHADKIEVVRGEKVRRGQVIARVGDTGGVAEPQLHFELRRDKKPVDPLPYLQKGGA